MEIRPVADADHDQILAIWNPVIHDSHATFNSVGKTRASLAAEITARQDAGHAFLVAADKGAVLGFATYGQFRASNGYRHTMEHTIILAPDARGRGLGRMLMAEIEIHARGRGHHAMFAGVSHRNPEGIAFHKALGYDEVARLKEVGWKFGLWYDLVLMQKIL